MPNAKFQIPKPKKPKTKCIFEYNAIVRFARLIGIHLNVAFRVMFLTFCTIVLVVLELCALNNISIHNEKKNTLQHTNF